MCMAHAVADKMGGKFNPVPLGKSDFLVYLSDL